MKKNLLTVLSLLPFSVMAQSVPTLIADVYTGTSSGDVQGITALGSEIYFLAKNGAGSGPIDNFLFRYKPSTGVTQVTGAGSLNPSIGNAAGASSIAKFAVMNNKLFFTATEPFPATAEETYSITEGGTPAAVTTGDLMHYGYSDGSSTLLGTKLYLYGKTGSLSGLCYIDASNTVQLAGPLHSMDPFEFSWAHEFTAFNNKIYFTTSIGPGNYMYEFNPTGSVFTSLVVPGTFVNGVEARNFWVGDNNVLYFSAKHQTEGQELYSMNASGTITKLTSLNTSADGVYDNGIIGTKSVIKFGNAIYFAGANGVNGFDLMKYDIATSTASLVKDINPSTGSSKPYNFYVFNSKLYFVADNGTNGNELWVTDGTAANTTMVADINTGSGSSEPASFCTMGGKMYFSADNGTAGRELYSYSGGTVETVTMLRAIDNVSLFPNPAKSAVTLGFDLSAATQLSVVLSDITGKKVHETEAKQYASGNSAVTIPVADLAAGVYVYTVRNANGQLLASGKFTHE